MAKVYGYLHNGQLEDILFQFIIQSKQNSCKHVSNKHALRATETQMGHLESLVSILHFFAFFQNILGDLEELRFI